MQWAEISIETTNSAQEAVSNVLTENGCNGTMVRPGEAGVSVTGYLPVDDRVEGRLLSMKAALKELPGFGLDAGSLALTVRNVEDEDWADAWKESFHTIRAGNRVVIKPSWEEYEPVIGDIVLEMDPGMAFGTGYHPTTQLCLKMLEKYMRSRMIVVDFGTGSGILALAAAKMKASLVIAFDQDEVAVRAARENVIRNGLEEVIEIHWAENPGFINVQADIVVANLLAEIVMAHASDFARMLRTGGTLIASGLVKERELEVEQSLRNEGFDIVERPTEDEWVCIVARKA